MGDTPDWFEITRRNARSVQTTIGWIFWDPGAVARYADLGIPKDFAGPLGYMAARCAPLAAAGPDAVIAAFGSISPTGIRAAFDVLGHDPERFEACRLARDEAVAEGLREFAPSIVEPLIELGPELWSVVEQLPVMGRVFMAAHLALPRPDDPLLSGWHAVNCIREWRGDTHWAVVVAAGLTHPEASILHNAHVHYETDWMPKSRGATPEEIGAGWARSSERASRRSTPTVSDGCCPRGWRCVNASRTTPIVSPRCRGSCSARSDRTGSPNGSSHRVRPCSAGST